MDRETKDVSSDLDWSSSNESMDSTRNSRYLFSLHSNEFINTNFIDYPHLSPLHFSNVNLDEDNEVSAPSFSGALDNNNPGNANHSQTNVNNVIVASSVATDLGITLKLEQTPFPPSPNTLDPEELFNKSLSPDCLVNEINSMEPTSTQVLLQSECPTNLQNNLITSPIDKAFSLLENSCPELLQTGLMPSGMCPRIQNESPLTELEQPTVQMNENWQQPEVISTSTLLPTNQVLQPQGRVQLVIASLDGTTMAYNLDGALPAEQLVLLTSTLKQEPSLVAENTSPAPLPFPASLPTAESSPPLPELPLDEATSLDDMNPTLWVDVTSSSQEEDFLTLDLSNSSDDRILLNVNQESEPNNTNNNINIEKQVDANNKNENKDNNNVRDSLINKDGNISEEINPSLDMNVNFDSDNKVHRIKDKPVLPRAWASLPITYLSINKVNGPFKYGVFARKTIPKRTQFGPIEGISIDLKDKQTWHSRNRDELVLIVEEINGHLVQLDISDENHSNWMRFVRPAKMSEEQNLTLTQQDNYLYFTTTRQILPQQELRVWYSGIYATRRGLQLLPSLNHNKKSQQELNLWPCFECNEKYPSSNELQKHLNIHEAERGDDDNKSKRKGGRIIKKNKKLKSEKLCRYQCSVCNRYFHRNYTLKRHLLTHAREKSPEAEKHLTTFFNIDEEEFLQVSESDHSEDYNKSITIYGNSTDDDLNSTVVKDKIAALLFPQEIKENIADNHDEKTEPKKSPKLLKKKNPIKPSKCQKCHKTFSDKERLHKHMLVHAEETLKPFQCTVCFKRFLNNSALSCHIKVHSNNTYNCCLCNMVYKHMLQFKEHVLEHCVNGCYPCNKCPRKFKEYNAVRKHVLTLHRGRNYGCDFCHKRFSTVDKLRMHMLKHSDHREFLCAECGKQFKRKDKLTEHISRGHSDLHEIPVNKQNILVTSHQMEYSSENIQDINQTTKKFRKSMSKMNDYHRFIYKCHQCVLSFKRRGMLVNHLAKYHPTIKPESVPELNLPILRPAVAYFCQYCDKVYKSVSKRKAHILKNHPGAELPLSTRQNWGNEMLSMPNPSYSQPVGSISTTAHSCNKCHKQYASKAKLLLHNRNKHPNILPSDQQVPRTTTQEFEIENLSLPESINFLPGDISLGEQVLYLGTSAVLIGTETLSTITGATQEDNITSNVEDLSNALYNPR